ncbi:MAG TPA: hypothetical protein VJS38_18265 [Phenylobacterium sp.]|uniref:hypothetical protein n=1 Tax=Phenylobacterium sp. TaxID=1871053 RepID=UPI002B4A5BFC|nr:hypothetical protein [Phenylobacterium sp.]HKR90118.1 hypothetical protein [Phenylobacterium sp.]
MHDPSEATSATHFPARKPRSAGGFRLAARAPGPETPDRRDRAGARTGMIILLAGGAGFWGLVAVVAAHLLH